MTLLPVLHILETAEAVAVQLDTQMKLMLLSCIRPRGRMATVNTVTQDVELRLTVEVRFRQVGGSRATIDSRIPARFIFHVAALFGVFSALSSQTLTVPQI